MRALTPLALLAFATSTNAAEPKVEVKETYLQTLAGVGYVDFDADRNPVFHLETGFYFAKGGTLAKRPDGATGTYSHYDRAGRVWLVNHAQNRTYYGGAGEWAHFDRAAVKVFDDTAGRVFLFDGKSVHVLGPDGKWSAQAICEKRHGEDVYFVEVGKRVWLWGSREKPGGSDGMLGAWSFTDGKWTHHDTRTGLPFDSVRWMHPITDGRFVVIEDRKPKDVGSRLAFWHPDRKLSDEEKIVRRDALIGPSDPLTGIDGTLYLVEHRKQHEAITITAAGVVGVQNRERYEDRSPHMRLHGRYLELGALGERPPVLPAGVGDFLGMDRDGRYYFCRGHEGKWYSKRAVVTVAWPKQVKPAEFLHVEKEKVPLARVVKDDAGKIWAEPTYGGGLLQWHAGKWLETPVAPLYHPVWTARPASPWNEWTWTASHLFRLHGKNGSLLAVRVRDVYQRDEPQGEGFAPPRPIVDPKFPHPAPPPGVPAGAEKAKYWLEAYLFHSGKWVGPLDIKKLFADHAAALLTDFPTTSGGAAFFGFANDGARLWAAFDGVVLASGADGKVIESEWPHAKPRRPLPLVVLATLADGKVVLAGEAGEGHALALADGKVAATEFKTATAVLKTEYTVTHWKLAKDGTFWLWTASPQRHNGHVWHFREGKWSEKKGIGSPLYDDANGNMVCLPEPRWAYKHELLVVNATETKTLTFPREEWQLGFTSIPKDARVWATGDALYFVDASGPKPVVRWRQMSGYVPGFEPAVVDAKGTVLLGTLRGQLER